MYYIYNHQPQPHTRNPTSGLFLQPPVRHRIGSQRTQRGRENDILRRLSGGWPIDLRNEKRATNGDCLVGFGADEKLPS